MIITNLEGIRECMGSDATTDEARRMVALLESAGFVDTKDVSDAAWFEMLEAAALN